MSPEKLPQGYRLKECIDLTRNRKQLRIVIGISFGWIALGILAGFCLQPRLALLFSGGIGKTLLRLLVLCGSILFYIIGHEAVHGAFMWLYSRRRPSFG